MSKKFSSFFILICLSVSLNSCNYNNNSTFMASSKTEIKLSTHANNANQHSIKVDDIAKEESDLNVFNNLSYEMFYGEWGVTENIFIDPIPIRGINYSDSEIEEAKLNILKNIEASKIQFTNNSIVINDSKVIKSVKYIIRIFPSDDKYKIHFTTTLKDIGLTEAEGKYYVFVETETDGGNEFKGNKFFIKNENTLIIYNGSYCIEYKRLSFNGGTNKPIIIPG